MTEKVFSIHHSTVYPVTKSDLNIFKVNTVNFCNYAMLLIKISYIFVECYLTNVYVFTYSIGRDKMSNDDLPNLQNEKIVCVSGEECCNPMLPKPSYFRRLFLKFKGNIYSHAIYFNKYILRFYDSFIGIISTHFHLLIYLEIPVRLMFSYSFV